MKRSFRLLAAVVSFAAVMGGVASAASSPSVSTGAATSIKHTSAVLNGTVNPNGRTTSYYFQWGLTAAYGVSGPVHSAGSGTTAVAVKTTASGLIPGTVYHYRLVATSAAGTTVGADHRFTTVGPPPPVVGTGPAVNVGTNSVTLTGVINPNGGATGWRFDYGTTAAYGSQTVPQTITNNKPQVVVYSLSGLASGTIFHYRLVAYHGSVAISYGKDAVFMTHPVPVPHPFVAARTRPHRRHHAPFVYTTTGHVFGPNRIPGLFDCNGYVAIRFFLGVHQVSRIVVPVQPGCSFSGQTAFAHKPGHGSPSRLVHLNVFVRFLGNGYLTPAHAHPGQVTLG